MRTKVITMLMLVLFTLQANSQSNYPNEYKARFSNLEPWVQTGILVDRNPYVFLSMMSGYNPALFSDTTDSVCTPIIFEYLHEYFYHSCFDSSFMKFHPSGFCSLPKYLHISYKTTPIMLKLKILKTV